MNLLLKHRARSILSLFLGALVCNSVLSSAAMAECGDYVLKGRALMNALPGPLSWPERHNLDGPMNHPERTCHGISCGSRDSVPPVPSAVSPVGTSQWAWLDLSVSLVPPDSSRCATYTCDSNPLAYREPVYHPPRPA